MMMRKAYLVSDIYTPARNRLYLYPVLIVIDYFIQDPLFINILIPCTLLYGSYNWYQSYIYYRAVADTPSSKIRSVAQGYAELLGRVSTLSSDVLYTPFMRRPCVWFYAYKSEIRSTHSTFPREASESYISENSFILDDGTGQITVDPEGAKLHAVQYATIQDGEYTYTEAWIDPDSTLYVLGEVYTQEADAMNPKLIAQDFKNTLEDWKKHPEKIKQFDRNADGHIDSEEWDLARAAALTEVMDTHKILASLPPSLHIRRPKDKRMMLLSSLSPEELTKQLRRNAYLHLVFASILSVYFFW